MVIKFSVGLSGLTEDFLVRIWEAESDTPGAYVYETTLVEKNAFGVPTVGAGHQVVELVTANGMDNVVHIVRIYGVTSGTLWNFFNYEPTTLAMSVQPPVRFKIGDGGTNTPDADQDTCTTPEIAGLTEDDYTIHRGNYGPLIKDVTYEVVDEGAGTWKLISPDQFNVNEEFTIVIQPQIVNTLVNDSVVGKLFKGFQDVSANTSYAATHLRKLLRFSGSPEYEFATSPPMHYFHAFQHFGSAGTAKIKFTNGTLLYKGSPKTELNVPRGYVAAFTWDGTNWNLVYYHDTSIIDGAGTPVAGTILGVGEYNVGDVAAGDPVYMITHNLAVSGNYMVQFSIKSNSASTYFRNNKICGTWYHHATDKPNKFYISLQEISGETQDLSISWVVIKM